MVGHRSITATEYATYAIGGDTERTEGMFGVVLHQQLPGLTRPGFRAYLSYGVNGLYFTERAPERQFVYGRTTTYTQPAWTHSQNDGMFFRASASAFARRSAITSRCAPTRTWSRSSSSPLASAHRWDSSFRSAGNDEWRHVT